MQRGFHLHSAERMVDERGNLYIVDSRNGRVVKETLTAGGYTQTVVTGGLHLPWGVAVDAAGNVFITNSYASKVLKETPSGSGYTQTLIGSGWNLPEGVAVDASGNVYITDYWNNNFVEVTPSGTQTAVGGGWSSTRDVVLDGAGNIYVADGCNRREELNVATPPSLTFATPTMAGTTDTTDGVRSLAITNIGDAPLVFAIPGTGSNPSVSMDFALMTGGAACPSLTSSSFATGSLAPAASCNLGVQFAPAAPDSGSVSGSLVLSDNNLNAIIAPAMQQSIALSGTATAPAQELTNTLPGGAWSMPAYFNNTVYYGGVGDYLKAFSITSAKLDSTPSSKSATTFGYPGATPSVSSNGTSNGIILALESSTGSTAVLHAYDATNLTKELYNSTQASGNRDRFGTGNKFITPMIINGNVYVGTPGGVAIFGLLP